MKLHKDPIKKHEVEDRLAILRSIKNKDGLIDAQKVWRQNNKARRVMERPHDKSDYMTNVWFTVKTAKDAELLAGVQKYDFIPLDNEARENIEPVKLNWNYWWLMSRTDKQLSKVIPEATAFWTWVWYETIKTIRKKIKEPTRHSDGSVTYKEKIVTDYDGIWCEYIPWENFFIDGNDIDNSNEVVWIKYWDRNEYMKEHELNPDIKNLNKVPVGKWYTIVEGEIDNKYDQENENIITELIYYNKSNDQRIVLANWVEVMNTPMPSLHKELPFCLFYDYEVLDRIWGMGEYELLAEDIEYRDALRSLSIDVIKAQMGTTMIDETVDIDETTFELGTNTYTRVSDLQGISFYSPNVSTNSIDNAELKVDNDIIAKSWIDFKAQQLSPQETAARTNAKTESGKKKINLNLKINGYSFFERLARLRMANIQLLHSSGSKEIFVEGKSIDSKWVASPVNGWYGSFTVQPKMIKGKFNIVPITESILGESEEKDLEHMLRYAEFAWNIMGADGKPVVQWEKLAKAITDRFGFDFDSMTSTSLQQQSPEQIVNELEAEDNGSSIDPTNPNSSEFVPPEQRSGATNAVPTSGWRASL